MNVVSTKVGDDLHQGDQNIHIPTKILSAATLSIWSKVTVNILFSPTMLCLFSITYLALLKMEPTVDMSLH